MSRPLGSTAGANHSWKDLAIALVIILGTAAAYAPVRNFGFVSFDDPEYVTQNVHLRDGVTAEAVKWAFTSFDSGNWHPLTWISHMVDVQLFGMRGGGHHLSSVLLHIVTSVLLFFTLKQITGSRFRGALIACMFAWHPLHVESVAWVSERKDVLAALWAVLSILVYCRYCKRPHRAKYALLVIFFALGLLSKPTVVTLPLVLLLLDIWPLGRLRWAAPVAPSAKRTSTRRDRPLQQLLKEKAPLFSMSIIASLATIHAQQSAAAVVSTQAVPLGMRLGNCLTSYFVYIIQFFWPANLSAIYPYPEALQAWRVFASAIFLIAVTWFALRAARKVPAITVGWFWYLIMLAPVIGIIQVGLQSRADRYMYLPSVGLCLFLISLTDILPPFSWKAPIFGTLGAVSALACIPVSYSQAWYWRDTSTLFGRAIATTQRNFLALNGLGGELVMEGKAADAIPLLSEALRLLPDFAEAHTNLGLALSKTGELSSAMEHYSEAVRLKPDSTAARLDLGHALSAQGRYEEAITQYIEALKLKPENAKIHNNLGSALCAIGRCQESVAHLQAAISADPGDADAHYNLGTALARLGNKEESISQFAEAIRLSPQFAEAHYNMGLALAEQGDTDRASAEFLTALAIKPDYPAAHNALGSVLAEQGKLNEALAHFSEAVRLKPDFPDAERNLKLVLELLRSRHQR